MQAVKGYLSNGWFTPNNGAELPSHARVMLVVEEIIERNHETEILPFESDDAKKQARIDWINRVESLLELSRGEDLSNFPRPGLAKSIEDYPWFD